MITDEEILSASLDGASIKRASARLIFINSHDIDILNDIVQELKKKDFGIYRDGDKLFTIEELDGRVRAFPVTPETLGITLSMQGVCLFVRGTEESYRPAKLKSADALPLMSTCQFKRAVPVVESIGEVRLPVLRKNMGQYIFSPLPLGLSKDEKVYSMDKIKINWDNPYTLEKSKKILQEVFKEFPFDGGVRFEDSRSFGGVIAALLGQFLRHNFDLFPIIQVNGNQSGLGKSFLVEAINAPFGKILSAQNFPDDEKEIQKKLFTAALEKEPVVYIDEVTNAYSKALLTYTTGNTVKDRLLGMNKSVEVSHKMQFFLCGKGIKSALDFERRTINIDLFYEDDARTRKFSRAADFIHCPDTRTHVLNALWGLCKAWENAKSPMIYDIGIYATYKEYIQIINSILVYAGYTSPLEERTLKMDTGDTAGDALLELLTLLADKIQPSDCARPHKGLCAEYLVKEMVEAADCNDLLDIIVGASKNASITLGNKLRALQGRVFVDSYGRKYKLGNKARGASTRYMMEILSEPTRELAAEA